MEALSFQYMLVWGLDNLNDNRTRQLAFKWAEKWVTSNYLAYQETNAMFEKVILTQLSNHNYFLIDSFVISVQR
jgi:alpha,alpha-trehalase